MGKTASRLWRHGRMKKRTNRRNRQRILTLKVDGPKVRPGRVNVRDLVVICQQAQTAIDRQAEALEGRISQRRGRKLEKVHVECTLELASLRKGSAALGFDLAKPQQSLPMMATFGEQVVDRLIDAMDSVSKGNIDDVDPGVLDSLQNLGEVFQRGIRTVKWVVPPRHGKRRREIVFDQKAVKKVVARLQPPTNQPYEVEGIVGMADFKATDRRCRIDPVFGPSVPCEFLDEQADQIYRVLRKPVKLVGDATINAQTGKLDSLKVTTIEPLEPLALGATNFFAAHNFEQLARMQDVEPLVDVGQLAGGWPEDEDVDQAVADIYARRE
jgi:hypothetical protein